MLYRPLEIACDDLKKHLGKNVQEKWETQEDTRYFVRIGCDDITIIYQNVSWYQMMVVDGIPKSH